MWPYWLMLMLPGLGAFNRKRLPASQSAFAWSSVGALFVALIGLRHEVGADWPTYESHFLWISSMSLAEAIGGGRDVGYYGLSWILSRLGGNIYLLNLLCAIPLVSGTIALARKQPWPWLGLFAAVPYLLIVVGMGYTRQSAAVGFVMLGLVALSGGRTRAFVAWTLVGASFHKSATLMIPIAALAADRNRLWNASWVLVMAALGAWLFLAEKSEFLWAHYVESGYRDASSGGPVRVAMNAVPALLLLAYRKQLTPLMIDRKLWTWMAVLALCCGPLLLISATATDRLALYFIPLQIFVTSRLCFLANTVKARTGLLLGVAFYYVVVEFVWLNFAQHASAWVPYQFMPLWSWHP